MRKIRLGLVVLIAFALVAAACGDDEAEEEVAATTTAAPATTAAPTTEAPAEPLRIAFMYDGEIDDGGWNEAHENGRQYLIANMDGIETTFVENLSPGSEFQAAFEDFGSQGYDLVICTTWCQDDVLVVAPNYPDTVYLSWGGYQTAPNVGHFDGATEDGRYLDGLVAGSQPGVELIGYVGGFAIEEVVRGVNAFMIGAREINPDVETQVVWVNSWYDPAAEQQAAQALVDAGADLLAAEVNAPAVASVAEASGIGYIHYGIDGSGLAPNSWLSGFTFNWGPYYLSQAQALADGTWEPALSYGGLRDGVVGMSPFGDAVTAETIALVEQRRQEIVDGTFDYFAGPITDNQGNVVIAEGATVPWEERTLCCQWLIEGVIGEIPAG
ncbi:MAG: BMP family ABC transporter substrate-binding protein, partial [Acidimicrobiaceae bacterium]|nr:BMP family ABC transporter substrate-binding protein [Acidimicrobiaceae bacterium]